MMKRNANGATEMRDRNGMVISAGVEVAWRRGDGSEIRGTAVARSKGRVVIKAFGYDPIRVNPATVEVVVHPNTRS